MNMRFLYHALYRIVWPFFSLAHPVGARGQENIPEGGAVLCANHSALCDPILVCFACTLRWMVRPMAKIELSRVPALGWLLGKAGVIYVDRGHADVHAVKEALKWLKEDQKLLVFPEGTRVRKGEDVKGKSGAALFATRTGTPLVPDLCLLEEVLVPAQPGGHWQAHLSENRRAEGHGGGAGADHRTLDGGDLPPWGGVGVKLRLAKSAGFCYGVRRAVELAGEAAASGRPCVMLGSIIHNRDVVGSLARQGLTAVDRVEDVLSGYGVIIRSHGESRETYRRLEAQGADILDATCPNVKRIHHIVARAEEQGRQPVIIGAPDHPEVAAIAGWCSRPVVLSGVEDLEKWLEEQPGGGTFPSHLSLKPPPHKKSGMTA